MQVEVKTFVKVIGHGGRAEFMLLEKQVTDCGGDNPRYAAEHAERAVLDVASRFRPLIEARLGRRPENGHPASYNPDRGSSFAYPPAADPQPTPTGGPQ